MPDETIADAALSPTSLPTQPLRCSCGVRRLVRTEVLGPDGNPFTGPWDEAFQCPACGRAWVLEPVGENQVQLKLAIGYSSVVAWRAL